MQPGFAFTVEATDGAARAGVLATPHGSVPTPLFMPVGTAATVKGVDIGRVAETGAGMLLSNAYHLHLRPGEAIVEQGGGLARFMGWHGPTLTDSGGYQVFSLATQVKVTEEGAFFRSHIDGAPVAFTPENSMRIQERIGADIAMQMDHVVALPAERGPVADAMLRSLRWAERCRAAHRRPDQALFGIVQGGLDPELRLESAAGLRQLDFPGYAVGGLSVGEGPEAMQATLAVTVPALPTDRPRYLMGVGQPQDIVAAVAAGIDMFDCVLPTRWTQLARLHVHRAGTAAECGACHRPTAARRRLPLPRLPPQPQLHPASLSRRRNARAGARFDPQSDVLSAAGGPAPRGDRRGAVRGRAAGVARRVGRHGVSR